MNSAVFKKNHYFCMSIKKWSKEVEEINLSLGRIR